MCTFRISACFSFVRSGLLTARRIFHTRHGRGLCARCSVALDQKKLSEMKTDFINNMTHEFKTPIATISLALDAINNKKVIEDPEGVARYSELIRQENKRMNEQVENVLRLAMLNRKELEMNFTPLDLHELLLESWNAFA